jgi:hypothetical protein
MMGSNAGRHALGRKVLGAGVLWALVYFGARALLEGEGLSTSERVLAAIAPIPLFAAFLWSYLRLVRSADELERRVHLEALGVAFPLTLLLLTTLGLFQRAIALPFEDWSYAHVALYVPFLYFLGLTIAWRRYR